ncbi:rRNA maturation RNase YbeY [soil metagenome]
MIVVEVEAEAPGWTQALPEVEALTEAAATAAARSLGPRADGAYVVLLADDAVVRDLNARFRGKDQPTNVLSFPAAEGASEPGAEPAKGDIVLAYETCAAEAQAQGKPLAHHLQHLVVHGVLHLLGFDHMDDAEAETMETREREVLAGLGVPDPYARSTG